MGVFAFAAGVNTASVAIQQRLDLLTRIFGPAAWYVHLGLVAPPWIWFLVLQRRVGQRVRWPLPEATRWLGVPLELAALALWLLAFARLGPIRTANGYFFGRGPREPVVDGVYRWLRNPMYDSYVLALVGAAFREANAAYLLLGAESFLLLNKMEASVENRPFPQPPRGRAKTREGQRAPR